MAFALEMLGYQRYKQHSVPLLEDKHKDKTYKGDYIIYTGNERLSLHAKKFFDLRKAMINEDRVKIVIGSRKNVHKMTFTGVQVIGTQSKTNKSVRISDKWNKV